MFSRFIKNFAPAALLALCLPLTGAEIKETPVTLDTQDGWALSALYMPAQDGERTVVLLHDLGKTKEAFTSFKNALAHAGFGYLAVDLRGYGQSTGKGTASSFAKEGVDNEFNKMTRDVLAALAFLKKKGVLDTDIAVLGAGLGANVAAKSVTSRLSLRRKIPVKRPEAYLSGPPPRKMRFSRRCWSKMLASARVRSLLYETSAYCFSPFLFWRKQF